jgi:pullulanase/glycogen debranching enzyme
VEEHLRGTYAGLGAEPVIKYIKELGVTSVELLPINFSINDSHLLEKGLTNYSSTPQALHRSRVVINRRFCI